MFKIFIAFALSALPALVSLALLAAPPLRPKSQPACTCGAACECDPGKECGPATCPTLEGEDNDYNYTSLRQAK